MIRIKDESEVVDGDAATILRKAIIEEINSPENCARKDEAFRRHQCMKDQTSVYVVEKLLKQFDDTTVKEMAYSLSNISFGRKIIDKLARVYSNGVQRTAINEAGEPVEDVTNSIQELSKLMKINTRMKSSNRYLRAHRNTIIGTLPCPIMDVAGTKYEIKIQPLEPHHYDVIEHEYDRERPMFIITSNYKRQALMYSNIDAAKAGRGVQAAASTQAKPSDQKDQLGVSTKEEVEKELERYVWWSKSFHFTTNGKGEILKNDDDQYNTTNDLGELPFDNLSIEQDGQFWAEGGQDIFDGAVHLNCMITNTEHIGVVQGYGQFWMKGKGLPRNIKLGPNKAILMEQESKDDPAPDMGFASSNPQLAALKDQVIMYVALLLTTNNLSTRAVAAELSANDMASGISLLIDKSESIEDVQDQQEIFREVEPEVWHKVQRWQEILGDKLTDDFREFILPADFELSLKFNDARSIMSEKEKLENLKLRKDLGINREIDLLKIDDPSLTDAQAEERLKQIMEEKMAKAAEALKSGLPVADGAPNADGTPGKPPADPNAIVNQKDMKPDESSVSNGQQLKNNVKN